MTATRVLVVESNHAFRRSIVRALSEEGFQVVGATSHVEDILMLVAHTRPHVIVLEEDIAIDTLAGLTRLIADRHPDVRTIILTNDRREHVRRRLYGVLVSAILEKPFTLDDLIGIIRGSTLHSLRFAWCL